MRRPILVVLAAAIAVVAGCGGSSSNGAQSGEVAQAGGPAKVDKAADEATLRAIYQKLPSQVMSVDTASIGAVFADDGTEITPGMPPPQGRDAVKKTFAALLGSMKNVKLTIGDAVVTVADAGDLAVVKAPYQMSYVDPKGKRTDDHGTTLTVFKKVNGQWKAFIDTNISEVAPQ